MNQPARKRQESLPKFMGLAEVQQRLSTPPPSDSEAEREAILELQQKLAEIDQAGGHVDAQRLALRGIVPECFDDEDEVTGVTQLPTKKA